ncbi:hypothetical protein HDU98_004199, partial [Podochytrium sp. JEL0797]
MDAPISDLPSPIGAAPTAPGTSTSTNTTRGRKRIPDGGSSDKRAAQLRESQRHHREKKAAYLRDLEAQVKQLTEDNKVVESLRQRISQLEFENALLTAGGVACPQCVAKDAHILSLESGLSGFLDFAAQGIPGAGDYAALVALPQPALALPHAALVAPPLVTKHAALASPPLGPLNGNPLASPPQGADSPPDAWMSELDDLLQSGANEPPKLITSESLFGPVEMDSARLWLKSLPSLRDSNHVDRACDLIIEHSRATDLKTCKKKFIVQFWGALLPPLSPGDAFNPITHPELKALKDELMRIPSFQSSEPVVNEFCLAVNKTIQDQDVEGFF